MDIIFEEPSEAALLRQRPGRYVELAIALRDHKDKWALVPDDGRERSVAAAQSLAQNIRRGITSGFTKGEYESVADGGKVFVRFTGALEPKEPAAVEPARPAPSPRERNPESHIVRQWARDNHYDVPDRGRISDEVWAAYAEAHPNGSSPEVSPDLSSSPSA